MTSRLHRLSELGQSVWIDFLSRDLLESGALARAIADDAVVGVTSNPTIFAKALSGGNAYDEQIATRAGDATSTFVDLAMRDVANACDALRPVWEHTHGVDGYVSIEVDPHVAGLLPDDRRRAGAGPPPRPDLRLGLRTGDSRHGRLAPGPDSQRCRVKVSR